MAIKYVSMVNLNFKTNILFIYSFFIQFNEKTYQKEEGGVKLREVIFNQPNSILFPHWIIFKDLNFNSSSPLSDS